MYRVVAIPHEELRRVEFSAQFLLVSLLFFATCLMLSVSFATVLSAFLLGGPSALWDSERRAAISFASLLPRLSTRNTRGLR